MSSTPNYNINYEVYLTEGTASYPIDSTVPYTVFILKADLKIFGIIGDFSGKYTRFLFFVSKLANL